MPTLTENDPGRRRAVTEALWTTLTLAYRDPGDRSGQPVAIPINEAVGALLTCVVNLVAEVPDAAARGKLITLIPPLIDRGVRAARNQPGFKLQPVSGIILPN
ncbi:MAG TPA: hypothetical protein ENH55_13245 [Aurantimonas coralicida]|uniref:Uncharacterized protein n=2 Tax=root TaxID=1 RepID=A0A9C9NCT7_9HYPH|nr:hypothetical protein [Aurantimonas coralicida]HET99674.1 hypothetical protein [Aurantimonas coralicida]